ncbi:hypothetical protein ACFQHV_00945 [Promicromonospora thailandica]|nr:hypothetical protein [Promicromonospora thailandica]
MLSGTIGVDGGTRADRLAATQAALDELQVVLVPLGWTVQASERGDWVRQVTPTPDPEG